MLLRERNRLVWNKNDLKNACFVVFGALLTAFGLNVFVASKNLLPAGFTGVATLIVRSFDEFLDIKFSFSILYLLLNLFPALFVYKYVGRKFTILSLLHVALVSLFTAVLPKFTLTNDTLLVCIFGGIFQAFGSLLSLKANASSGGTDFIAIYFSNRYNQSLWNYVLIFNGIILVISGLLFDIEAALYSIIYQFTSTQIVNTFHDRYHLRALLIITKKPDLVSEAIFNLTRRGITQFEGIGKYTKSTQTMLYMVVGASEVDKIIKGVKIEDTNAFISDLKIHRVFGNFYQKPFE